MGLFVDFACIGRLRLLYSLRPRGLEPRGSVLARGVRPASTVIT